MSTLSLDVSGTDESVTAIATLLDPDSNPLVGRTIYFEVTGANSANGIQVTDANGEAEFFYAPSTTGTDRVTAQWGDPDGLDLVYADIASTPDHVYRLDGFSTTVVDDFSLAFVPSGLGFDGSNLLSTTATVVNRHDGISATVTSSITPGHSLVGVAWSKEGNLITASDFDVYVHDGFSTTILSTFPNPYGDSIQDIGYDGNNLLIACENFPTDGRIYRMVGTSSTVDAFFTDSLGGIAKGVTWDGQNILVAYGDGVGGVADRVRKGTGFGTPFQAEVGIPSANPVGLVWAAFVMVAEDFIVTPNVEEGWGMLV